MPLMKLNLLIFLVLAQSVPEGERRTITELEALELLQATPNAQSIALQKQRDLAEARRPGVWPNPAISFTRERAGGVTDEFLTVEQALPVTGRLGLEREAAEVAVQAAAGRLDLVWLALRADVRTTFYDLLFAQHRTAALVEGRDRMEELVQILRIREQEGESSGFDRMRAERELAEVGVDLLEARREQDRARLNLSGLLALEGGTELWADGRLEELRAVPPLDALLVRADTRGDVVAYELERQSGELRHRAASRRAIPEPSLILGMKKIEGFDESGRGPVFSLTVPLPLFNRGQADAALAEADQALARSRFQARRTMALTEIESVHQEVLRRREAEELYRRSADSEELVRIARMAYDEGEQGILELLDSYRTALAVRLRGLELAAASRRSRITLDLVVGEEVVP